MAAALVVLLMLLCIVAYTFQTFLNKLYSMHYTGPANAVTPVFSVLYGVLCGAATLFCTGLHFHASPATWVFGLANGLVLFLFNLSAINAARTGPYSFQSILMLFGNILMTAVFSAAFWGDRLGVAKSVGIVVMLAALAVINCRGMKFEGIKKGYFWWVALLFFSNGTYGILMDAQQRVSHGAQHYEMIAITFLTSAVISLAYLIATQRRGALAAFRMRKSCWIFAIGSAVAATVAVNLLMILLGQISASVLYTVNNGSILVLSILLSAVVLKEKIPKVFFIGVGLTILSIVLLSL